MSEQRSEKEVLELAAQAVERQAAMLVEFGRRMGLAWGPGQQAKHAGYLEAANIVRNLALAAPSPSEPR